MGKNEKEAVASKNENTKSKSWEKREARKAAAKAAKREATRNSVIENIVFVLIAAVIIFVIGAGIYESFFKQKLEPAKGYEDFGKYITEDGFIQGAKLDGVKDIGLNNLVIPAADVDYSDEKIDSDIEGLLASFKTQSTDAALTVAEGDTINIDYDGTIDGVAFDGGSSGGMGYNLKIGSQTFIEGFEEQLIGSHPGDSVEVVVTFPDNYQPEDLAGKEAVFACTVNSITVAPEVTDDFVKENFSDMGSSVAELREYLKNQGIDNNIDTYITTYISENASVKKLPKKYLNNEASVLYFSDQETYAGYNQFYTQVYGYGLGTFEEFTGMTQDEYEKDVMERAKSTVAQTMTYESVFKNNNLTVTDENYQEALDMVGSEETYGVAYVKALAIRVAALEFIKAHAVIQ